MMKIVILGAGAMGSWFGGKLALSGQDVSLLTTNQLHRDAINSHGLVLRSRDAEQSVRLPAVDPAAFSGAADIVMLFTKTFQSEAALTSIANSIGQNTHVLTLQNGLGNAEIINQYVPFERILLGVTMMPVDKVEPGVVQSTGEGDSYFNCYLEQESSFCQDLLKAFTAADLRVKLDPDILGRIWSKVAFNAGMNAVCALAHGTPGTVGDSPGAQSLVGDVAREVVAVAVAEGIDLDLDAILDTIDYACKNHRDHKPSMHHDLLHGRRTEVDAINGAIVTAGKRQGTPTPLNALLQTLVHLAELSHQRD
jgi:2-dehydropantoate 2-reductase